MRQPQADFWSVTASLSKGGLIAPLASRGIVGQVTNAAVVYDAETTQGGSGGPVLDLTGEVVAVNAAILPEFGGSNIGVPVSAARELLDGAGKIQARLASPHLPLAEADSGGLTAP
jgi:S1-C subfamily serine protease